jgi:hypothetical protein
MAGSGHPEMAASGEVADPSREAAVAWASDQELL